MMMTFQQCIWQLQQYETDNNDVENKNNTIMFFDAQTLDYQSDKGRFLRQALQRMFNPIFALPSFSSWQPSPP